MQVELVGDFWETDLFIYFRSKFPDFSKSLNSFWLRIIFADTLIYKESNGASLMSVAALYLMAAMLM